MVSEQRILKEHAVRLGTLNKCIQRLWNKIILMSCLSIIIFQDKKTFELLVDLFYSQAMCVCQTTYLCWQSPRVWLLTQANTRRLLKFWGGFYCLHMGKLLSSEQSIISSVAGLTVCMKLCTETKMNVSIVNSWRFWVICYELTGFYWHLHNYFSLVYFLGTLATTRFMESTLIVL